MGNILTNLKHTVISGFVLAIVLAIVIGVWYQQGVNLDLAWWSWLFRWLHVLGGVMWIGLLYYLNFVQVPSMPKIDEDKRPAITGVIAPAVMFWFRWGAMWTIVSGLIVAGFEGYIWDAIAIGLTNGVAKHSMIGIGMWLGAIMWFNVWFVIWPNQQIVLGLNDKEGDKVKAGRTALLFSRTNTMLSVPMLWAMTSAQNLF